VLLTLHQRGQTCVDQAALRIVLCNTIYLQYIPVSLQTQ
jgi:hypothetical protein